MGSINKIQDKLNITYGNNTFSTKISDNNVEFDTTCDNFIFSDKVDANINGVYFKILNGKAAVSVNGSDYYEMTKGDELDPTPQPGDYLIYLFNLTTYHLVSNDAAIGNDDKIVPVVIDNLRHGVYCLVCDGPERNIEVDCYRMKDQWLPQYAAYDIDFIVTTDVQGIQIGTGQNMISMVMYYGYFHFPYLNPGDAVAIKYTYNDVPLRIIESIE